LQAGDKCLEKVSARSTILIEKHNSIAAKFSGLFNAKVESRAKAFVATILKYYKVSTVREIMAPRCVVYYDDRVATSCERHDAFAEGWVWSKGSV
jgi:hypothetical protein